MQEEHCRLGIPGQDKMLEEDYSPVDEMPFFSHSWFLLRRNLYICSPEILCEV